MNNKQIAEQIVKIAKGLVDGNDSDGTYKERQKEVQKLLKSIASKLKKHSDTQKKDPKNWGYAGDLGNIVEILKEADSFLK